MPAYLATIPAKIPYSSPMTNRMRLVRLLYGVAFVAVFLGGEGDGAATGRNNRSD